MASNNIAGGIWSSIKERADKSTNKLIKDMAVRDAHEANVRGEIDRNKPNDKKLEDVFNAITGSISQYDENFEATAGIIRGENEVRLSNDLLTQFNTDLENATTNEGMLQVRETYQKRMEESSKGADPQYVPQWELTQQKMSASLSRKQNRMQKQDAITAIMNGAFSEKEALVLNPIQTKEDYELVLENLGNKIKEVTALGGNPGQLRTMQSEVRIGLSKLSTTIAESDGEDATDAGLPKQYKGDEVGAYYYRRGQAGTFARDYVYANGVESVSEKSGTKRVLLDKPFEKMWYDFVLMQKEKDKNFVVPEGAAGKAMKDDFITKMKEHATEAINGKAEEDLEMDRVRAKRDDVVAAEVAANAIPNMRAAIASGIDPVVAMKDAAGDIRDNTNRLLTQMVTKGATAAEIITFLEEDKKKYLTIFDEVEGVGRARSELLQDWTDTFGGTLEAAEKVITARYKEVVAEATAENKQTRDNGTQFVDPNGGTAVLPQGINLDDDLQEQQAISILINSSFWHLYHADDGTVRREMPDLHSVINQVVEKHAGSVSEGQQRNLRRIVSDLVRTEAWKKSTNKKGWYDKARGRYGYEGGVAAGEAPLAFDIGGSTIDLTELDVQDNVIGQKLLQASAKTAGGQVNPQVSQQYRDEGITFDGSVQNVIEAYLASGEVPHHVYVPNENYAAAQEEYVDETPPAIYNALEFMENWKWQSWFFTASQKDRKQIDADGKRKAGTKPNPAWVQDGLILPIHHTDARVMTPDEVSDLIGGIIEVSGVDTGFLDSYEGEGLVSFDWSAWEAIRAVPQIFSESNKWTPQARAELRENIDSGLYKLVNVDVRDNGKTTVVKVYNTKTGVFGEQEFIISSLRRVK